MLQTHDIRETRVYQDALKEGREEGAASIIVKMAAKGMSANDIAALLDLDVERVLQIIANSN